MVLKFVKVDINYLSHNFKLKGHIAMPATQLHTNLTTVSSQYKQVKISS